MRPLYLLSEKAKPSTTRFSKALWVSDDKLLRSLSKEYLSWADLHREILPYITTQAGWVIAVDDSVQDRIRTYETKSDIVGQHYSWNHKCVVNWVDVITIFWVTEKQRVPLNFRVYSKEWGKNKHQLFLEMIDEVLSWWYQPSVITADSYYATNENVANLIQKGLSIFMGVKSNRLVREVESFEKEWGANYQSLCTTSIPWEGKVLHFKWLWLFKTFVYEERYYIYHSSQDQRSIDYVESQKLTREEASIIHRKHWYIEEYHRALKQLCNFEGMIFRSWVRIINHIFYSIKAFCIIEITRLKLGLENWYKITTNDTIQQTKDMMNSLSLSWLYLTY
jgi:hypothetical protein